MLNTRVPKFSPNTHNIHNSPSQAPAKAPPAQHMNSWYTAKTTKHKKRPNFHPALHPIPNFYASQRPTTPYNALNFSFFTENSFFKKSKFPQTRPEVSREKYATAPSDVPSPCPFTFYPPTPQNRPRTPPKPSQDLRQSTPAKTPPSTRQQNAASTKKGRHPIQSSADLKHLELGAGPRPTRP